MEKPWLICMIHKKELKSVIALNQFTFLEIYSKRKASCGFPLVLIVYTVTKGCELSPVQAEKVFALNIPNTVDSEHCTLEVNCWPASKSISSVSWHTCYKSVTMKVRIEVYARKTAHRKLTVGQEARVALGCTSSNSYASFVISKLSTCINSR